MSIGSAPLTNPLQTLATAWRVLSRLGGPMSAASGIGDFLQGAPESPTETVVSPQLLAATLTDLGVKIDDSAMALADSFSRVGVAITGQNITSSRNLLMRLPGVSPAAVAIAAALGAPRTRAVLQALTTVLKGLPDETELSPTVLNQLSITIGDNKTPADVATQIRNLIGTLSTSAENRIAVNAAIDLDPRLLLLALSTRQDNAALGANLLATNIEGQQVLNQAAHSHDVSSPLYFGFYATTPEGRTLPVEVQVRREEHRRRRRNRDMADDETRTTVRVAPDRLGLMEVHLTASADGKMRCDIRAERFSTARLLRRHAPDLAESLTTAGWHVSRMTVAQEKTFPPLWFGGESMQSPRNRFDRKA